MAWSFLSNHNQAVVSSVLLIAVFALFPARFGSLVRWVAIVLGAALVDQGAKALLLARLAHGEHWAEGASYLGGRLLIGYDRNDALGFDASFPFLLLSTLALVLLLCVLYQRLGRAHYRMSTLMEIGLALIVGGLLGILLDRLRLKYVIDFLEFGPRAVYTYNLADLFAILGGALALSRFGELGLYMRLGLRRPMPRPGETEPDPPLLRTAPPRWRLQLLSLCVVAAVALHFMWQVGAARLPPLQAAAQRGDLERVQKLLRRGARINSFDATGEAPLHYAVQHNHEAVAEYLLSKGARVNQPDAMGLTPLYYAMGRGVDSSVAELLVDHGADVNASFRNGFSPLHAAIFWSDGSLHGGEAVRLLLEHGARPTEADLSMALHPRR